MRRKLSHSVCTLIVLAAIGFTAQSVHACSCAPPPTPQMASENADSVFVGKVLGAQIEWFGIFSGKWLRQEVLFQVDQTWKGIPKSQVITSISSNSCCGWTPLDFPSGDDFLVYAQTTSRGDLETSYWHGTQHVAEAEPYLATLGVGKRPPETADLTYQFFMPRYLFGLAMVALGAFAFLRSIRKRPEQPGGSILKKERETV